MSDVQKHLRHHIYSHGRLRGDITLPDMDTEKVVLYRREAYSEVCSSASYRCAHLLLTSTTRHLEAAFFLGTVTAKWCHCVGLNLEGPACTGPNPLTRAIYRSKQKR
jgi:hypothetical protein